MRSIPTKTNNNSVHALIRHVARYRLALPESLATVPALAEMDTRGQRQLLRELVQAGLLAAAPLTRDRRYYHLTAKGAARFGLSAERSGPLSEPAKLRCFAMLAFCCLSDIRRQRLMSTEVAQHLPDLYRPGMPSGYYLELASSACRLGLARVDGGGQGRWDRIIQTCHDDLRTHDLQPAFRQLIEAGRFEIAILTPFSQKAKRLRETLRQLPHPRRDSVRVVALPQLLPLIVPQSVPMHRKEAAHR